ncbi:MAG: helix-turn-helix transcriptional regulator [Clostridiales bacterium]|nr:helix-turn-helix transcriptional regulator [Clostridiales bacterium]
MDENLVELAKNKISQILQQRQISMEKLAELSGLTLACISNWYGGRKYVPSIDSLEKVAKALDISLAYLFCSNEEKIYLTKEQKDLINDYICLTENQKNTIKYLIKSFKE